MVTELYIKVQKGQKPQSVASVTLVKDCGIKGDCHFPDIERGVCLVNGETAEFLKNAGEKYPCILKFTPNIVFSGNRRYTVDETLTVGSTELQITAVGRKCHGICPYEGCPLIEGAVFARVAKDGEIRIGDTEDNA